MSNAIKAEKPRSGDRLFLTCGCGAGDTLAVVVTQTRRGRFITALVCPGCDTKIPVNFGHPKTRATGRKTLLE